MGNSSFDVNHETDPGRDCRIEKQEERTVKKRKRYLALAAVLGASTLSPDARTAADFTYQRYNQLKTVFTTNEPAEPMEINTEDLWARYYSARIDDETMIVIEQNPEQLH